MKKTINTETLLNLLTPLQSVVNDNHVIPILQNVKLEFLKKEFIVTGNDLEVSCSNLEKMKSTELISFCTNFTMLLSIVKSVSDKEIEFNISKNDIRISHSKGKFNLPIEDSREFPKVEKEIFNKQATVNGKAFRSAIKVANKFVLNDDVSTMANVSISIGKKIHIRSTYRNRLFEEKIKGSGDAENILLSGRSSVALFSLLEDSEDNVEMRYNSNSIFFKSENKEIIVIQQQGDFPLKAFKTVFDNVKKAVPIKINVKEFVTSLKRVSILSTREKYSNVRLDFTKKSVLVSCESKAFSTQAEETLDVKFSDKRLIGFNYKYLIEILSIFDEEPDLFLDDRNCLYIKQGKKTGALSPLLLDK